MPIGTQSDWHLDAIFYQVYVRGFQDSDNDGIGDLNGLISRLDYLQQLGVTCLWLMPILESPLRDDGYDVSNFLAIDPTIGNVDDFERLTTAAHARQLKVITDLVVSHTSAEHAWFQDAKQVPSPAFTTTTSGQMTTKNTQMPASFSMILKTRTGPGVPPQNNFTGIASLPINPISITQTSRCKTPCLQICDFG